MNDRARPAVPPVVPAVVPPVPERELECDWDPLAEPDGVVPIEPNGHLLNLYRHRERQMAEQDRRAPDIGEARR